MSALLANTVQPPVLTLLSSTSQPALSPLFTAHTDPANPSKSIIAVLPDNLSRPRPAKRKWDAQPDNGEYVPVHPPTRGDLGDTVIHVQGPKMGRTYIQAGTPASMAKARRNVSGAGTGQQTPLGVELPWVHFQLKRLGARAMAVEVGVVDLRGVEGIIRCSTFQANPMIHPHRTPPLLHLPLVVPAQSHSTMTQWLDLSLNLASLLPLFQTLPRPSHSVGEQETGQARQQKRAESELPNGQFGSISYVRVYANCRIRRIWFSEAGERTMQNIDKREFTLVAAAPP